MNYLSTNDFTDTGDSENLFAILGINIGSSRPAVLIILLIVLANCLNQKRYINTTIRSGFTELRDELSQSGIQASLNEFPGISKLELEIRHDIAQTIFTDLTSPI